VLGVQGLRALRSRVSAMGFEIWDLGFGVWGLGQTRPVLALVCELMRSAHVPQPDTLKP